jgi:hypothetical protein
VRFDVAAWTQLQWIHRVLSEPAALTGVVVDSGPSARGHSFAPDRKASPAGSLNDSALPPSRHEQLAILPPGPTSTNGLPRSPLVCGRQVARGDGW